MQPQPKHTTTEPIAHLREDGTAHLLDEHLRDVGELAARFADAFGASDWARLAGLWHDLGKYSAAFQRRIREENGFEAHVESLDLDAVIRDHSTAGAALARRLPGGLGIPLSFMIAGHHAGLADRAALDERLTKRRALLDDAVRGGATEELLTLPSPAALDVHRVRDEAGARRLELWIRMVFSALCDADFLDTERFYDPARSSARIRAVSLAEVRTALDAHVDGLERSALDRSVSEVDRVRAEVRRACVDAARQLPGFFSLTVPTGGGKTLASMSFALAHTEAHGLSRVIVAVPYTAIIEQNSDAYRAAFGALADAAMIEHYSALDPRRETWRNRLASENWDAPVVITTTVQLFESLFGHRTSRCRKLHNLARAVIVLDEAQTLPVALLDTVIDGLRALVRDYGATVVFCTATQPAFRLEDARAAKPEPWRVAGMREIVAPELRAFERLKRVAVRWPSRGLVTPYEELATELAALSDVMAIVHLRRDARTLTELLDARLGDASTPTCRR
ncbi:MAG: CRISPR-associated endonuclease Cas3'' [Polyangiales bacterium]